ncbi:MAG: diguanylate cyclase [Alphaproteobacteria bacterium]|nr:diguanylate cyclase [Alphaproteobacteria bacterium]
MPHFQQIVREGIEFRCNTPEMLRLLSAWQRAAGVTGGVPALSDIAPDKFPDFAGNMLVLKRLDEADFQYEYYGETVAGITKFDMTGRRTSDFSNRIGAFFASTYEESVRDGIPIYSTHTADHVASVHIWERLLLPCRAEDGSGTVVVYIRPLEFKHEILEAILEATPDGIITFRSMRNPAGDVVDFTFVTVNPAAARTIRRDGAELLGKRLTIEYPRSVDTGAFDTYRKVVMTGEPTEFDMQFKHDDERYEFRVSVACCGDGVVVTLTDITQLKNQERDLLELTQNLQEQQAELRFTTETLEDQAAFMASLADEKEIARQELEAEIERRTALEEELRRLATTDPLTGICNRRHFFELGEAELARWRRHGGSASLLMLDIDHFKSINDTYGHDVGDLALMEFVTAVGSKLRKADIFGRLGGEEFAVILPETPLTGAIEVAERIRAQVGKIKIECRGQRDLGFTVSVGAAEVSESRASLKELISEADGKLYQAKQNGRNRIAA